MQYPVTRILFGLSILFLPWSFLSAQNQSDFWELSNKDKNTMSAASPITVMPTVYQSFHLNNPEKLAEKMNEAPKRFAPPAQTSSNVKTIISLPTSDGSTAQYELMKFPVMARGLAARFPNIKTYTAVGIDDPTALAKIDFTPKGFHALILTPGKSPVYVDPLVAKQGEYIVYNRTDFPKKSNEIECQVRAASEIPSNITHRMAPVGDCQLRQYRLALACTGEYAIFHNDNDDTNGDITSDVLSAMVTTMNRVNGIFEQDLGVTMEIINNNDDLIFTNSLTDPYTNDRGEDMLNENQLTCDNIIGNANYDIGHVFSTGGGGIATLRSPCVSGSKARGVTGQESPEGDPFDIDFVAHEIGHQFGGNHTQNNDCQRTNASVEPGSASTIMGYAGICAPNIQNNSDAYFHVINLVEFANFIAGNGGCANVLSSANASPAADAGPDYMIPVSTPFELTATGSDPDGDPITYCWEQMDNETGQTMPPQSSNNLGPNFRSYSPTLDPVRTIPNLRSLLYGGNSRWEALPAVLRVFNFTVSVRDNHSQYGCVAQDEMTVTTVPAAGPFVFTYPVVSERWMEGETRTLTWDVANTDLPPILCSQVDILMSTDGGFNFVTLSNAVDNDGNFDITVPNFPVADLRFKIACSDNIFFTITPEPILVGFETECTVINSTDIPVNISDLNTSVITSEMPVSIIDNISRVKVVNLSGDHSFVGDLVFSITHPNGSTVELVSRVCTNQMDFNLEFFDAGGAVMCPLSMQQTVAPNDALHEFIGLSPSGTWTLRIEDTFEEDGGSLNNWGLEICTQLPLSALPVELLTLNAEPGKSQIDLFWETGSERNNAGFEVHRSKEPSRGFEQIGRVEGFGTNGGQRYHYVDEQVRPGQTYYYQLRQMDYDEQYEWSKIVSATIETNDLNLKIRPNPVNDFLTVSLQSPENSLANISMLDALGRVIMNTDVNFNNYLEQTFSTQHLANGIYLIRIELASGTQIVQKFLKE